MSTATATTSLCPAEPLIRFIQGDAAHLDLPDASVHCVVTSPPFWGLRSYSVPPSEWPAVEYRPLPELPPITVPAMRCCLGAEPTPAAFVAHLVLIFREVRRVMRSDACLFLNMGDSYQNQKGQAGGVDPKQSARRHGIRPNDVSVTGLKPKDKTGIPWRLALALQGDGWWLRQDNIWDKPNCMPSAATDRTTTSHEYVLHLTKLRHYFYDADAIRETVTSSGGASFGKQNHDADGTGMQSRRLASPEERNHPLGRNKRSVLRIPTTSYHGAHFAVYPIKLVLPWIMAGTSERGCCPSCGAPWRRVVEKITVPIPVEKRVGRQSHNGRPPQQSGYYWTPPKNVSVTWLPSCKCPAADPVPCTILDPFSGAGTTACAALKLGRSCVGVELNGDYIELGRRRLDDFRERLKHPKPKKAPRHHNGEMQLWPSLAKEAP